MHFFIGDEQEQHDESEVCNVRAIAQEVPEDEELCAILLESGADSAIFPARFAGMGTSASCQPVKLHDAQGTETPILDFRDIEVQLLDETGRMVLIRVRERVAISESVHQPILCCGKLMQNGWSIQSDEQVLSHKTGLKVPIELQNRSIMVNGWVRALKQTTPETSLACSHGVFAVRAEVMDYLSKGPVGWQLDRFDVGVGRHFSDHFQDPSLIRPGMTGPKCRTTDYVAERLR